MDDSLRRLSPFLATLLAQLRDQYGLDLDASLRDWTLRLLEDRRQRPRAPALHLAGRRPIDAIVPVVRIDGHWYLADFVGAPRPRSARGGRRQTRFAIMAAMPTVPTPRASPCRT